MWAGPRWIPPDGPSPFALEVEAGPLELPEPTAERPPTIVAHRRRRAAGARAAATSRRSRGEIGDALGRTRAGPAARSPSTPGSSRTRRTATAPRTSCSSSLGGDGALELLHPDGTAESHPVHAGHVISRPAGTGVAHAFGAGDGGLELLAYSTDDPADMCFYPRSGKISIRGLKAIFRVQRVDYWDGEE